MPLSRASLRVSWPWPLGELLWELLEIGGRPGTWKSERRRNLPLNSQPARSHEPILKESYAVSKPYQVVSPTAPVPAPDDVLERLVREGASKMLQDALEAEVDDFLGRRRYECTV